MMLSSSTTKTGDPPIASIDQILNTRSAGISAGIACENATSCQLPAAVMLLPVMAAEDVNPVDALLIVAWNVTVARLPPFIQSRSVYETFGFAIGDP